MDHVSESSGMLHYLLREVQPTFGRDGRCVYMKCAIAIDQVCHDEERDACVFTKSLCFGLATGGVFYIRCLRYLCLRKARYSTIHNRGNLGECRGGSH
jgi:hypothetical protein